MRIGGGRTHQNCLAYPLIDQEVDIKNIFTICTCVPVVVEYT